MVFGTTAPGNAHNSFIYQKEITETALGAEGQGFNTTQPIRINAF